MERLKLLALDGEDLAIISAHCQDAVIRADALSFSPGDKKFSCAMNRFVWERVDRAKGQFERRGSVLHFDRVERAQMSGIDHTNADQVLSLLSVTFSADKAPGGTVEFVFSGGGGVRLQVECVEAQLSDLPAAWAAASLPSHDAP